MKVLAIGWVNLKRMLREKSNIFFVFILPIGIILLVGAQFGGGVLPVVGIHQGDDGRLASSIVEEVSAEEGVEVISYDTRDDLLTAVERGAVQAGTLLPPDMDHAAAEGEVVEIGFLMRPDGVGPQLQAVVSSAVARKMTPVSAAQFATAQVDASFDEALAVAEEANQTLSEISVETLTVGEELFPSNLGRFDLGAAQQLVLFIFLTALSGSAALILTRQLGISTRMLSTPTSVGTVVAGEGMGRFTVALAQGVYIVAATLILFRVDWGDPMGAAAIVILFAAVGAGAGLLAGALFKNDQQAAGISVMLGLGLAALGGAMLPIELFSDSMRKVAHITPHAWALDGFAELVRDDGTILDILPELGVLAVYAVILFAIAGWRLRRVITRP